MIAIMNKTDNWQAMSDLNALQTADEVRGDKKRLAAAQKYAATQAQDFIKRAGDLKKFAAGGAKPKTSSKAVIKKGGKKK